MTDFLEVDFCKSRALRVSRRLNVSDGLTSEQLAGATSLGCNIPVSHRADSAPGFVLSRVNKQSGVKVSDLLASLDERTIQNPGPTAYLSAAPDAFMSGAASLPFPATLPVISPRVFGSQGEVQQVYLINGMGSAISFRTTVVVPPGDREYIDPGPLADHPTHWYYGCVSSPNALESYTLTYGTFTTATGIRDVSLWRSATGILGGGTGTLNALDNWQHTIHISIGGTPPAMIGYAPLVLTPPVEAYTGSIFSPNNTNGPQQTARKFSYPLIGADVNPPFGGTSSPNFVLSGLRPTLTVFRQQSFDGFFGGFSIFTVNGTPLSFSSATLPTDQYRSPASSEFNFAGAGATNFYEQGLYGNPLGAQQGRLYSQNDIAAQVNLPAATTTLQLVIRTVDTVVGQPSLTFNFPLAKNINQHAWFEVNVAVESRHVGAL